MDVATNHSVTLISIIVGLSLTALLGNLYRLIRERKRVDLVVELQLWQPDAPYDRIGLEDRYRDLLGVSIREVVLPVRPGRNMSSIIEIAARNELLRQAGHHPAREFVKNLEQGLLQPEAPAPRTLRPPSSQFRGYSANESSAPPPVTILPSSERKP